MQSPPSQFRGLAHKHRKRHDEKGTTYVIIRWAQTQFYKKVIKTSCGLEQWFETSVKEKLWFTEQSFILVGVFLYYQGLSHRCRGRSCRCERWRSAGGGRRSWQGIGRGTESHTPTPGDAYLKEDTHDNKKHILLMQESTKTEEDRRGEELY